MKNTERMIALGLVGIIAAGVTAAGCATAWFGNPKSHHDPQPIAVEADGNKVAAAAYINGLCKLSKEQRDPQVRALNEAILPNHATISCGPGSGPGQ
jgi:hypothetical protein